MRNAWILATVLALSFAPALTQAREKAHRSGKEHSESRSAKSRSEAKSHSKVGSHSKAKAKHRSSSVTRSHRSARTPARAKHTARPHRSSASRHYSHSGRSSHDVRRSPRHVRRSVQARGHSFHRAPRYRRAHRSIHIHPTFLPSYRYGYFWSGGYYYPRYYFDYDAYPRHASLRILAHPSEAEVYVDGYYAGIVDDFDGFFQRLHVAPGTHEITLRLDGFRTWSAEVFASPHRTVKVHHDMIPGLATEADYYDY